MSGVLLLNHLYLFESWCHHRLSDFMTCSILLLTLLRISQNTNFVMSHSAGIHCKGHKSMIQLAPRLTKIWSLFFSDSAFRGNLEADTVICSWNTAFSSFPLYFHTWWFFCLECPFPIYFYSDVHALKVIAYVSSNLLWHS